MQNDKELFDFIRNSSELVPRNKFVIETKHNLIKEASKLNKRKKQKKLSFYGIGVALSILSLVWLFYFQGYTFIVNSYLSAKNQEEEPLSSTFIKATPSVFIYHTHSWESFREFVDTTNINEIVHESKNVTLVGEKLMEELQNNNISVIHDKSNIQEILDEKKLTMVHSYDVSREFVENALKKYRGIKMVIDIHRDSQRKDITTIKIDNKDYAKIAFVVSKSSKLYNENKEFAMELHEILEERYPGLSRGVITQGGMPVNTYNQDLHPHSLLINIGGVDNTVEELQSTTSLLAEVIYEVLNQME